MKPPLVKVKELETLINDAINDVNEEAPHSGNMAGEWMFGCPRGIESSATMPRFPLPGRSGRSLLIQRLRVESIDLMTAALASDEVIQNPDAHKKKKDGAIRVFFRCLLSRSNAIVKVGPVFLGVSSVSLTPSIVPQVAKKGLLSVLAREKLPKELLQTCLRPVLLNLADYRKLTVVLLDGLSRLLELLSNCFNLTLGEKLKEHLEHFANPETSHQRRIESMSDKAGTISTKKPDDEVCQCVLGRRPAPSSPAPRVMSWVDAHCRRHH